MGKFSTNTKPWIRSVINQRRVLMRINKSHKDRLSEDKALDRVESQLSAFSYDNDQYLARFIIKHIADIDIILPGKGARGYDKRQAEWSEIRNMALDLMGEAPFNQPPCPPKGGLIPSRNNLSIKSNQYELIF